MKRVLIAILSVLAAVCTSIGLSACNDNTDAPASDEHWEYYGNAAIGFASAEDCPNGKIENEFIKSNIEFQADDTYYLVLDYTFSGALTVNFEIGLASAVSATLQEAQSGDFLESTADDLTYIQITHKSAANRKLRAVVRLSPAMKYGKISVSVSFKDNGSPIASLPEVKKTVLRILSGIGLSTL